jgi:UPF0716 protein FxsA
MLSRVGKLLLFLLLLPVIELILLIELGRRIGTLETLGVLLASGLLGGLLARRRGLGVLRAMRAEIEAGRVPAGPMVDGVMVLLAAGLLITPGLLTDALAFLCLVPLTRRWLLGLLWVRLVEEVRAGRVRVSVSVRGRPVRAREPRRLGAPGDREAGD